MTCGIKTRERWALLATLLIAWTARWVALMDVPPGWRDDDLIELYTFSKEILESGPQLYFTGASGHEPLYHTIRAPLIAVAGLNQASARWLAASAGMLSVLLTWAVGRQLFGGRAALGAAASLSVSFWNLMYSRVAIRHIGALPWMLVAIYWAWRELDDQPQTLTPLIGIAVGTAGAVLTYYAGRLIPALLLAFLPVLWINIRRWPRFLTALGVGLALTGPMFIASAQAPGADARVSELAGPLYALAEGNAAPFIQTTLTTLSMFHATGDPEWLYNISGRPVFGTFGAVLFFAALFFHAITMGQRRSRFLLLWLLVGLAPAFISFPPSSYGHTVLAMPAVYLILARVIALGHKYGPRGYRQSLAFILTLASVASVGGRDLPDYFVEWGNHSMVEFLYRADYRALAQHLDAHDEIEDAVVGSMLLGPWDRLAVRTDLKREKPTLRWINPTRSLVLTSDAATRLYLQHEGQRHPAIEDYLLDAPPAPAPEGMEGFLISQSIVRLKQPYLEEDCDGNPLIDQPFESTLALSAVEIDDDADTEKMTLKLWWMIKDPLPLPLKELIPHPPPPGVYSGPRLKVFVHSTRADSEIQLDVDDGIGVDPYTLSVGDLWLQVHSLEKSEGQRIRIGLYDPKSGARWRLTDGGDMIWICPHQAGRKSVQSRLSGD